MRLLASGRESDIFDLGDGTVLRRYKAGGRPGHEAAVMEHARVHGFPAARVLEQRAGELVLERIDGPTMLEELHRDPSRADVHASTLAHLHADLHEIAAPPGLEAAGAGDTLLHLDFHPGNVLFSPTGPVVIDWTNARRGNPALDVALTWVLLETSEVPGHIAPEARRAFTRAFVDHFDRSEVEQALRLALDRRIDDANVLEGERDALRRMAARLLPGC